jgi:hypothetical protein
MKEIEHALAKSHQVTLVYFKSNNWSRAISDEILANLPELNTFTIDSSWWVFRFKIGHVWSRLGRFLGILPIFKSPLSQSICHSERSYYLHKKLKSIKLDPDWVIAHTLPAFAPALIFSKQKKCKLGIDVEDFHPGERIAEGFMLRHEISQRKNLMKIVLPLADYVTYASSGIRDESLKLQNSPLNQTHVVIENAFWQKDFEPNVKLDDGKLNLVWFSQNISKGRGLEKFAEALSKMSKDDIHLTLIGKLNPEFYHEELKKIDDKIEVIAPLPLKELNRLLSTFDIGLASEVSTVDRNRDICLTNKIWAYSQAGLYILASNTSAQKVFIEERPGIGEIFSFESQSILMALEKLTEQKYKLRADRQSRNDKSQSYSFEHETKKLNLLWTQN